MKKNTSVTWLIIGTFFCVPAIVAAANFNPSLTAAKLMLVHSGFWVFDFVYSDKYLANWESKSEIAMVFPQYIMSFNDDVNKHLQKQKNDIVVQVTRNLKNGNIKQGTYRRVAASFSSMPRPASFSDFTYAIGGCTIPSYADIYIGFAGSDGTVTCAITSWVSVMADIYKFDNSDSFNLAGYAYFPVGELYSYEQRGFAKKFNVSAGPFYNSSVIGEFVVKL